MTVPARIILRKHPISCKTRGTEHLWRHNYNARIVYPRLTVSVLVSLNPLSSRRGGGGTDAREGAEAEWRQKVKQQVVTHSSER